MPHKCNNTFDFNFVDPPKISDLEGGSTHSLSNFEMTFRNILKQSVERVGRRENDPMDRFEITARMSRKLGRDVTKTSLDQWIAMSTPDRRIPVDALKALCEVIGDFEPMETLIESCGFKMLTVQEARAAEYGATILLKEMIDNKAKKLKGRINPNDLEDDLTARLWESKC